jgi:DNA-binding NarL/FixJ family response regulator
VVIQRGNDMHNDQAHAEILDVLLLDIRMPGKDGIDVLRTLLGGGALPPTLILTTFDDSDVVLVASAPAHAASCSRMSPISSWSQRSAPSPVAPRCFSPR